MQYLHKSSQQYSHILYNNNVCSCTACITTTEVLYYELSADLLCSPLAFLAYINGYSHLDMMCAAEMDDGS